MIINIGRLEREAQALLAETELFDELGLGRLAAKSRVVANGALELVRVARDLQAAEQKAWQRLDDYTRFHQAHCFNPDGTTCSGTPAEAFRTDTQLAA